MSRSTNVRSGRNVLGGIALRTPRACGGVPGDGFIPIEKNGSPCGGARARGSQSLRHRANAGRATLSAASSESQSRSAANLHRIAHRRRDVDIT
eukprot:scaffold24274_cov146-Isochrysis_galbana.AAC.3